MQRLKKLLTYMLITSGLLITNSVDSAEYIKKTSQEVCSQQNDSLFNQQWLFHKGEAKGAEVPSFTDAKWRKLKLPHDWAIEGPFDIKYNTRNGGLPFYGTGWYRKHFIASEKLKNKIVRIAFDGAMNEATVWINGHKLGFHPYGYTSFEYEISKYLKYTEDNIIAVKLTPEDKSSRWYPGAGIYRNVYLKIDNPIHVAHWGVFITTPTVTDDEATIQIETKIDNQSNNDAQISVQHRIFSALGEEVTKVNDQQNIAAGKIGSSEVYTKISKPHRWDIKTPYLYTLETRILVDKKVTDTYYSHFGARTIDYRRDGFYLNGKKVKFKGVCLHADNGPLGSAINVSADEHKFKILKEMGVNAIRTSHNPVAPEFLDLCDKMGFVVMEEAFDEWEKGKVDNGYHKFFDEWSERDIKSMINRDRNHPSIVLWSIGNEIPEQTDNKNGFIQAKRLASFCKEMDTTRPTTAGLNSYPNPFKNNFAQQVDLAGMNYKAAAYKEVQQKYPDLLYYGSETSSCTSSRGIYHLPLAKYQTDSTLQVTSYDFICPSWAYPPDIEFYFQKQNPNFMGEFVWTGFDYLGEPTPYGGKRFWPSRSSYFGIVDLCGLPKDRFYLYQSQWTDEPMIHLLPHWNWKGMEGQDIPVYVYTNCDEAELFLNGKSLGRKVKGVDKTRIPVSFSHYKPKFFDSPYRLSWNVPYAPGTLTVKAYKDGMETCEKSITTAGEPYKITLTPDRTRIKANGVDLSYITVRIEDKYGNLCPRANNLVNFNVSGSGSLKAVGNGNAATTESFQVPYRKAFSGKCMLIVESKTDAGEIEIKATSQHLKKARIELTVE